MENQNPSCQLKLTNFVLTPCGVKYLQTMPFLGNDQNIRTLDRDDQSLLLDAKPLPQNTITVERDSDVGRLHAGGYNLRNY